MTCKYIHQNFLIMLIYSYMLEVIFFLEKKSQHTHTKNWVPSARSYIHMLQYVTKDRLAAAPPLQTFDQHRGRRL